MLSTGPSKIRPFLSTSGGSENTAQHPVVRSKTTPVQSAERSRHLHKHAPKRVCSPQVWEAVELSENTTCPGWTAKSMVLITLLSIEESVASVKTTRTTDQPIFSSAAESFGALYKDVSHEQMPFCNFRPLELKTH